MRAAHLSDLHYAPETLAEVDRCVSAAVTAAIAANVDVAFWTGDATDHRLDVHSPAFLALAKQVKRMADHCPVVMLQGTFSHEPPGTLSIFGMLGTKHPILIADRLAQAALMQDGTWLMSEGWRFESVPAGARLVVSLVPTVNKAVVAASVGAVKAGEAIGDAIAEVLQGMAPINVAARAQGIPTFGLSHGTVNGCETEHGVPMAALDHEFTEGSLFGAQCDAFLLGHIHKCQSWVRDSQLIAYAGSIARLHYGEVDPKGWLLWEVAAGSAVATQQETPARKMIHLEFDGAPDLDAIRAAVAGAGHAFVRVRYAVGEENRDSIDREAIKEALSGCAGAKIEGRIIPVVRSRAAGISRAGSLSDKLSRWGEVTKVDVGGLQSRLMLLQSDEPQAIVDAFLAAHRAAEVAKVSEATAATSTPLAASPESQSQLSLEAAFAD